MKYVTIAIEDNSAKILEASQRFRETAKDYRSTMEQVGRLQTEGLLKMLAYIRCAYEDYTKVCGKAGLSVETSFGDISVVPSYIRIHVFQDEIYAEIHDGHTIEVRTGYPKAVANLMQNWQSVKQSLHKTVNERIASRQSEMDKLLGESKTMLRIAQNFKV